MSRQVASVRTDQGRNTNDKHAQDGYTHTRHEAREMGYGMKSRTSISYDRISKGRLLIPRGVRVADLHDTILMVGVINRKPCS